MKNTNEPETRRDVCRNQDVLRHHQAPNAVAAQQQAQALKQLGYPLVECHHLREVGDLKERMAVLPADHAALLLALDAQKYPTHVFAAEQVLEDLLDDFLFRLWPEEKQLHIVYYGDWYPML